ncbi:UNVERIFIED_CONTAM: hypothetical protein FKN15_042703 [Acipenser sinensis]
MLLCSVQADLNPCVNRRALRERKKMGGEKMPVQMIGDILAAELSHMQAYIRFCSCQLNGAAILQEKTDEQPEFKDFLKILENTSETYPDYTHLKQALERAEELCSQVNEGVRKKENSDRLEWIQTHIQCDELTEQLIFNSLTNCLGPRKLLHSGKLYKTKSNKELYGFLFNDFLLLTYTNKQLTSFGSDKLFSPKSNSHFKIYKTTIFLNEVLVKLPTDPSSDEPVFHISHIDRVYTLKTENINERTAWVQKIKAASEHFIQAEKKKREKAYQARSLKTTGIGRLLVNIIEATELKSCKPNGCADLTSLDTMSPIERKRQGYIHELIETEERYMDDLQLVVEVFQKPLTESEKLTESEMGMIFVNWKELIMSNFELLKALRERKKMGGEKMPVQMIGDILAAELSHMQAYIRFCSCQLNGAAILQEKTDEQPEFKDFLKRLATDPGCKGMPFSSFLLKPMQRITRYPLIIKNILENTSETYPDYTHLKQALERAEELCSQVNEGVRKKENSDRLEWIQTHIQCDELTEQLIFNSLTNCLGPRKLLHSGKLYKTKSNKELYGFLFNDFLLLTYTNKQLTSFGSDKLFSPKSNSHFKIYKTANRFYVSTSLLRTAWVQKIKAASEHFIQAEKKKREKAYQARSLKTTGIGRLLVNIIEATELKSCKPNGRSSPYCEITMGYQCFTTRTLTDTLNPKWNFNCQFFVKNIYQDVLCITVYERDQFSPDDFLGRTEVPVATIKKEQETKGPTTKRLLLHEVPTGEVWARLDLQLYEQKTLL